MTPTKIQIGVALLSLFFSCLPGTYAESSAFTLKIEQLTCGDKHHFFGYIEQCQTIPWNAGGRYVLGMEIDRIDPSPRWNRTNDAVLVPGLDENGKRQMFVIRVTE